MKPLFQYYLVRDLVYRSKNYISTVMIKMAFLYSTIMVCGYTLNLVTDVYFYQEPCYGLFRLKVHIVFGLWPHDLQLHMLNFLNFAL